MIIGVQKGGTTTLFHQLSQHPQIDNPAIKETHYFDLNYDQPVESYINQFKNRKKNTTTGEASPYYFFHPHVAARVHKYFPDVKLVLLLRNPAERAYSHYQMARRAGFETIETFEEAISKEDERIGEWYEKMVNNERENYTEVQRLSYLSRGNYVKQLKTWLSYFKRENFLFIESEEYYSDPETELKKIHSFLGLDYVKPQDLTNQHKGSYELNIEAETAIQLDNYFKEVNKELPMLTGRKFSWL
jgi:lipopolysaccharide transport system ATP-binding protein